MKKSNKTLILSLAAATIVIIGLVPYMADKVEDNEVYAKESSKKRCVAYYTSWSGYERDVQIEDIDTSVVTHINFAFANLKSNGEVILGDPWIEVQKPDNHFSKLRKLKKKNPKIKTLISIGGGTWSGNFSDVAASDKKRKAFAKSALKFIKKHGFDGIDIDWEFPVSGGTNVKHRKSDKQNYTKLVKETRKLFESQGKKDKKKYLITIAGGPGINFTKNTELKSMMKYLDFINIMNYDYHGSWENMTNHNAPLYINPKEPTKSKQFCVSATVSAYKKAGVKAKDLNLGLATYGRSWTNVSSKGSGLFKKGTVPTSKGKGLGTWQGGVFEYWDLEKNYINKNGYKRYYDKKAKVPYLYNGKNFISYDDKESIKEKIKYAKKQGLGGVMFWELAGDKKKTLQKAMKDNL